MTDHTAADDFSAEHRLRRTLRPPVEPKAPRRGRIGGDVAALALAVVTALVLMPFADSANLDYPEARAVADRLEAAVDTAATGVALTDAAAQHGLVVADFAAEGSPVRVLHDHGPTANGECYGMRVGAGVLTAAVRFEPRNGECLPADPSTFDAIGSWSDVLPSERRTPLWFIPAMVVLIGSAVSLSTRIVVRLVSRGR